MRSLVFTGLQHFFSAGFLELTMGLCNRVNWITAWMSSSSDLTAGLRHPGDCCSIGCFSRLFSLSR
jgi:hypothetical protein